jgi:SAM-dependent methyltransferase
MGVSRDEFMVTFGKAINDLALQHRVRFEELALNAGLNEARPGDDASRNSRFRNQTKTRWVDGTPENSFFIYELSLLFPEARFIHLIRDPRSVARSLVYFHTIGGPRYTADAAYREWLRTVKDCHQAEQAFGSQRVLRVRYSDMVGNREETVGRILDFVGEPYSEDCAAMLSTRINSSVIPNGVDIEDAGSALIAEAEALAAKLLDPTVRFEPDGRELARLENRLQERSFGPGPSPAQRDLLRQSIPRDAIVLVASGGDKALLRLGGPIGWHFPQNGWGAPVAAKTLSDDELIQDLERLRAIGAQFLFVPTGAGDVLAARVGVTDYLERWYSRIAVKEGIAALWGLAVPGTGPPPPPANLNPERTELVARIRDAVRASVPADARVAVVSRGDDELLKLPVVRAAHFPSGPGMGWAGHHPSDDDEALVALDAAVEAGATHILIPAGENWWLDFYPRFRTRLESCRALIVNPESCSIFGLRQPAIPETVENAVSAAALVARPTITFICNVCSSTCSLPSEDLQREAGFCATCGSTSRHRAVIATLSQELFGQSMTIDEFPQRPDLRGIGLTDAEGYAQRLAAKLGYANTYYHQEPHLDIQQPDPARDATLDFLIASDVFEHVVPPLSQAFKNAHRLLKPDGVLVLTVPWGPGTEIVEHFPELHDWDILMRDGKQRLRNVTRTGEVQEFDELVFHGGPGLALELRQFGERGLLKALRKAGFSRITCHRANDLKHGAYWPEPWSHPVSARP